MVNVMHMTFANKNSQHYWDFFKIVKHCLDGSKDMFTSLSNILFILNTRVKGIATLTDRCTATSHQVCVWYPNNVNH